MARSFSFGAGISPAATAPAASPAAQEALRTYAKQREILTVFYGKYDPAKTAAQITAILDKRKGDAACVPEQKFTQTLGTLQKKYGGDAMAMWESQRGEREASGAPGDARVASVTMSRSALLERTTFWAGATGANA